MLKFSKNLDFVENIIFFIVSIDTDPIISLQLTKTLINTSWIYVEKKIKKVFKIKDSVTNGVDIKLRSK